MLFYISIFNLKEFFFNNLNKIIRNNLNKIPDKYTMCNYFKLEYRS